MVSNLLHKRRKWRVVFIEMDDLHSFGLQNIEKQLIPALRCAIVRYKLYAGCFNDIAQLGACGMHSSL